MNHRLLHGSLTLVLMVTLFTPTTPSVLPIQTASMRLDDHWDNMPLYFIANRGQLDSRVAYYLQGSDKTLYFTPEGVTFELTKRTQPMKYGAGIFPRSFGKRGEEASRWTVKLDFLDANPVRPSGQEQTEAVISYFKGTPEKWKTGLPTYEKIVYPDLWEGIDLAYSGTVNLLKHEFVVQPGANPARIRLAYRGASMELNAKGQLEVSTPAGDFQDDAPVAYQEVNGQRVPVSVTFALENSQTTNLDRPRTYGFNVGAYDKSLPLVIDPAMRVYSGFLGGSGRDFGTAIAVDKNGYAYITGNTTSTEGTFPETVGPDLTFNGLCCPTTLPEDAFVAKVKADGTGLVYAGYIGGDGFDNGAGIAVDADGNAYVAGDTDSSQGTFPVIGGPDLTFNSVTGYRDAFVTKVNVAGTGLVYSGYIGGPGHDAATAIALDKDGNAYVTGDTGTLSGYIDTFPILVGPDLHRHGIFDAFVAKVNADGMSLGYSGFIGSGGVGGFGIESGWGIAVDLAGSAYITGYTSSGNPPFPAIVGPDLSFNGGQWDAFVTKVKADGTGLVYSGYIGGNEDDYGTGIAVDTAGSAYVTGYTKSTEESFPVVVGPDLTYAGGYWEAFVVKVKEDGTGLAYAGYIGGDQADTGNGIAVDSAGSAYVTGSTKSGPATFPVNGGPDLSFVGNDAAFVAKLKANGTGFEYSGYAGSGGSGHGIAVDAAGDAYIIGDSYRNEATFTVIGGPDLTFNGGDYDAFVAKISYGADPPKSYVYIPVVRR